MRRYVVIAAAAAGLTMASAAAAQTVTVDAQNNSTTGGTALLTTRLLVAGQTYHISQNPLDLWASGSLPRWSDGNGIVQRLAVPGDDSGQPAGTQIGTDSFGNYTQGNLTARYGSLVAVYGPNQFQFLGANTDFVAAQSGLLSLGYFDSNSFDNVGAITFQIDAAVPEPAAWALMIVGFGAVGATMRRRRADAGSLRTA